MGYTDGEWTYEPIIGHRGDREGLGGQFDRSATDPVLPTRPWKFRDWTAVELELHVQLRGKRSGRQSPRDTGPQPVSHRG